MDCEQKHWGNGFAYEAAKAIIAYFSENKTTHFTAHCNTENIASYKTMEKLGMIKIG
ncbi:MAG: GNAT family N-acetyltransferase [Treponema sp.]|nr:GNAT family N-acetyltransferase [Treponema sp.]